MSELARQVKTGIDISSAIEILGYTVVGSRPIEVIVRADLGDNVNSLNGAGGTYLLHFYINGTLIVPDSVISVAVGAASAIMISQPIPLRVDDVITVQAVGQALDTNVNTVCSLRDVTSATITDFTGIGDEIVDHNYGGSDVLRVLTPDSVAVIGADILAIIKSDYDAGRRDDRYVRGRAITGVDGRWLSPMLLVAETYVVITTKPGYISDLSTVVVNATTTTTTAAP